jgi:hypothetical protein
VFVLVMLPTLTASLQALGLEAVAKPVGHLLDTVVELIPRLISAALIVAIGAVVGRIVSGIVTTLLAGAGLNKLAPPLGKAETFRLAGRDASELAGGAVMVAALLLAVTQACEVLGFAVLTEAVGMLGGVLAHLAVAVVLLGVGLWLATATATPFPRARSNMRMCWPRWPRAPSCFSQAPWPCDKPVCPRTSSPSPSGRWWGRWPWASPLPSAWGGDTWPRVCLKQRWPRLSKLRARSRAAA